MSKIATFVKGLIRRVKEYMKEFNTGLIMALIGASFILLVEGLHASQQMTMILLDIGGVMLFLVAAWLWNYTVKQIRQKEAQEKKDRDSLTMAITDLVDEIRKDRTERDKRGNGG